MIFQSNSNSAINLIFTKSFFETTKHFHLCFTVPLGDCLERKKVPAIIKEYIERRHGEPFKFLFLPRMGLLGSQAVLEKKTNSEL
jgi:hypothetical protein